MSPKLERFVFTVRDTFRMGRPTIVVTGRVESGEVQTGDAIDLVIEGVTAKSTVRGLEISRTIVTTASAGDEIAIMLDDVEGAWIGRGTIISR